MAAVYPPEVFTRPATARRSTVPAAPKLRCSCLACADSKVKCNKEKPTCGRCAKRGLACEYCVTKRAGRGRHIRSSDTPESSLSSSSETTVLTSPNATQPSAWQHTSVYPDILPNLLSPADSTSEWTFAASSTDFDDFFASSIPFPVPETSDLEILGQPNIDSGGIDNNLLDRNSAAALLIPDDAFSIIDNAVSEFPTLSEPLTLPDSRAFASSDAQSFRGFRSESSCCCLVRALSLLKQLFPTASTACTRSRRQGYDNATFQLPTIQSVVADNEQTIEAISNMLQCQCSQDSYLLTIISLMVFKVLGWYAAAARDTPVTDDSQSPGKPYPDHQRYSSCHSEQVLQFPTVVGSYRIDGEDQGRMAAQLVLSELHRVQRLINLLSQRLKEHGIHCKAADTPDSATSGQDTTPSEENTLPFSTTMLNQLEADLRKRLRALSLEIVDILRRG